jgi:MFS transporter, PPP family, 3-phenylpropionic acid transporter
VAEDRYGAANEQGREDRDIRWLFTLGGVATAAILPFFSPLLQSWGLSPERIGLVLSAMALGTVLAAPAWSHEADTRLGTARTLVWSTLATAVCALLLIPASASAWSIAVASVAMAAATASGTALGDALALQVLGPERGDDYGRIRRFASLGWAIAAILFGALYQTVGLSPVVPLYAACLVVYAWWAHRFHTEPAHAKHASRSRFGSVGAVFAAVPRFKLLLAGLLLLSVATSSTDGFVPLRMLGTGGGPFLIGVAVGLAAVIEIPLFTASSSLGARYGMRNVFLAGAAISILTLVGYAVAQTAGGVAFFRALSGAAFGLKYGALVVLTDRLVPAALRNTGQTLMQLAHWSLGPVIGPAIGGFVYVVFGPPALFGGAAVVATGAALLAWWSLRDVREPTSAG